MKQGLLTINGTPVQRERLADFKVPRHLHFVESIPRTPTGKVQRRFVAEQLAQA